MFLLIFSLAVIAIYNLFDVNYFVKLFFISIWTIFSNKKKLLDTTTTYGICSICNVALNLTQMNNKSYLHELDLARIYYYIKTGFYWNIYNKGGTAFQTASNIQYYQPIFIFMPYKITTKIIYWEDKHFYMEQRFIGLMNNIVYAIVLNKQTLIKLNVPIQDIFVEIQPEIKKPELSKELKYWLESIQESSENLKKSSENKKSIF